MKTKVLTSLLLLALATLATSCNSEDEPGMVVPAHIGKFRTTYWWDRPFYLLGDHLDLKFNGVEITEDKVYFNQWVREYDLFSNEYSPWRISNHEYPTGGREYSYQINGDEIIIDGVVTFIVNGDLLSPPTYGLEVFPCSGPNTRIKEDWWTPINECENARLELLEFYNEQAYNCLEIILVEETPELVLEYMACLEQNFWPISEDTLLHNVCCF